MLLSGGINTPTTTQSTVLRMLCHDTSIEQPELLTGVGLDFCDTVAAGDSKPPQRPPGYNAGSAEDDTFHHS